MTTVPVPTVRARWLAVALVAAVGSPMGLDAGEVSGHVRVSKPPAPQERSRTRYPGEESRGAAAEKAPGENPVLAVVVYLHDAREGWGRRPDPTLAQQRKQFSPRVLPVKVGATVAFPNKDPFYHNVFSYSKIKKFDLGRYKTGDSRSVTFDQVGLVKVFCEIHSHMKAHILVLPTNAFTVPNAEGQYQIKGVPAGTYTLVAWHPTLPEKTSKVTIGATPAKVDIDF